MFEIIRRFCDGRITLTLFDRPIFLDGAGLAVIPPGFIYQPRLAIPTTPYLSTHWSKGSVEEK